MNRAMVLNNMETTTQPGVHTTNTCMKSITKVVSMQKPQKGKDSEKLKGFSAYLESCNTMDVGKQQRLQQSGLCCGSVEQLDNSMCNNSPEDNIASGIVGTLEGFGLLDFQTDPNETVIWKSLNGTHLCNIVQESTEQESIGIPESAKTKGFVNKTISGQDESGQFAGMRPQTPLVALHGMTQEDIMQRVGTYFCSLKSTSTTQSGITTNSAENHPDSIGLTEGSVDIKGPAENRIVLTQKEAVPKTVLRVPTSAKNTSSEPIGFKATLRDVDSAVNELSVGSAHGNSTQTAQMPEMKDGLKDKQNETVLNKENVLNIVDKINTRAVQGRHDFDIQLKPEFLGKINIKLSMENSSFKVRINTSDEAVKALIADQMPALQSMLEEKGITVSQMDVFCESETFAQQDRTFGQNNGQGGREQGQSQGKTVDAVSSGMDYDTLMDLPQCNFAISSVEFCA